MIPTRPHGVERIDHGFYRGARCLIRNYNKIILKRNSNILNTLLETIELCSIYIAQLKPVSPIILQEAPRIVRSRAANNLPMRERLLRFRRSVVCITATNVAPRELLWRPNKRTRFGVGARAPSGTSKSPTTVSTLASRITTIGATGYQNLWRGTNQKLTVPRTAQAAPEPHREKHADCHLNISTTSSGGGRSRINPIRGAGSLHW